MELFRQYLSRLFPLATDQWHNLSAVLVARTLPVRHLAVVPGQIADRLYFVMQGGFRSYLLRDGEDITDYFFFEYSFATDFVSYHGQKPAVFYLECLEGCSVVQIKRRDFLALSHRHSILETMGRVMAGQAFVEIEERMRLLHHKNLETRFRWIMDKFPQVFQRVPQYHSASYLGVKPESLSRLKKQIGKNL